MESTTERTEDLQSRSKLTLPRNVRLLSWASLLNDVSSEAVYPLLPKLLLGLGGDRTLLGLLEGLADTTASLLKLWFGTWSDRIGKRKPFITYGYALAGLTRPLLAFATRVDHVFAIRLFDRVGKGLRTAPRDAMIAESTPQNQRGQAFGYHRAMDHLGAAIGPLLAAAFLWFYPDQLPTLILLTLIPGLMVLGLQYFGLSETKREIRQQSTERPSLPKGPFRIYLLALLAFTFANSSDAFLLVRAEELGVTTVWLPVLWALLQVTKSLGNRIAGGWADRISPRRLIVSGWLFYTAVYVAFGFAFQAWHVWLLFVAYALFYALTEPAEKKLMATFGKDGKAGNAFGWFHSVLGIANLPSSLLFGWLYQTYGAAVAFSSSGMAAVLATIILLQLRTTQSSELQPIEQGT